MNEKQKKTTTTKMESLYLRNNSGTPGNVLSQDSILIAKGLTDRHSCVAGSNRVVAATAACHSVYFSCPLFTVHKDL